MWGRRSNGGLTWALTRLAHAEFWKAFQSKKNRGTPAALDFRWLTIFFALSSFLIFFGFSARQGLWERVEQVLLGALPGSSSPIRVGYHFVERPEKITAELIGKFRKKFPTLTMVPMRVFDGQSGTVVLPGLAVDDNIILPKKPENDEQFSWGKSADGGQTPLRIYAVPVDSPIWQWVAQRRRAKGADLNTSGPLVVAASRTLFSRHFRYNNYYAAVARDQRVPCTIRNALPEGLAELSTLESLALEVKEGYGRSAIHSFDVIWVDSFPLPEQIAIIMPLRTAELLLAAEDIPKFGLHLEAGGRESQRIKRIRLRDVDFDSRGAEEFRKMAACLGAATVSRKEETQLACGTQWKPEQSCEAAGTCIVPRFKDSTSDLKITAGAAWPLRERDVASCARNAGLGDILAAERPLGGRLTITRTDKSSPMVWRGPSRVGVPCSALTDNDRGGDRKTEQDENRLCEADITGYPQAMVYPRARQTATKGNGGRWQHVGADSLIDARPNLKEIVTGLLDWKPDEKLVFRLDPAYQSALVRFGVLEKLIDLISTPLGFGIFALYCILLYVILATAFLHRRAQYGLLAMNGVCPTNLRYVVGVQIMLGCTIGCAVGYVLFLIAAIVVNLFVTQSEVISEAGQLIGLEMPRFVSYLTPIDFFIILGSMGGVALAVGWLLLSIQGVSNARAPIELLK